MNTPAANPTNGGPAAVLPNDAGGHLDHDHEPGERPAAAANSRVLIIALAITLTFMIVEIVGGLAFNSLALLADAGHMGTDVIALGFSLFAIWLTARPVTTRRSYGFARAEILATLFNAVLLIAVSVYIFYEAWQRFNDPPEVKSGGMLLVAVAGLIANTVSAFIISRGSAKDDNLNVRGALLHVISDLLGSVGAIAAALIILATGWNQADPLLSAVIGLLVLRGAWNLLSESVEILLEATPRDLDPDAVLTAMNAVPGVVGVHDLHIWTVTSGLNALSAHVETRSDADWETTLIALNRMLREQFDIAHATIQPELSAETDPFRGCTLDTPRGVAACRASRGLLPRQAAAHAGRRH